MTVAESPVTVSGVRVAGSTVTLTLATAVEANQAVTLAYNTPGTNPIQDTAGNDAAPLLRTDRDPQHWWWRRWRRRRRWW